MEKRMKLQKLKVLKLKSKLNLDNLAKALVRNKYDESSHFGFLYTELEGQVLRSQYIEKKINTQEVLDPFGDSIETELVSYQYIDFELHYISQNTFLLVLLEPQRAIKSFSLNLAKITDYSISLDTILIDIESFLDLLSLNLKVERLKVERLKISSVPISNDSAASMEIVSKANALDEIALLTHGKTYVVDRVKSKSLTQLGSFLIEVSKTGGLTIDELHCKDVISLLGEYIVSLDK